MEKVASPEAPAENAATARASRLDRGIAIGAVIAFLGTGVALWAIHGPSVFGAMITGLLSFCF